MIRYLDDWKPSKLNDVMVMMMVGVGHISMNCISLTRYTRLHLIARKRDTQPGPDWGGVVSEFHPESPMLR